MDCHLILRNSHAAADSDPGLVGNLLVERMVGAHIHQVVMTSPTDSPPNLYMLHGVTGHRLHFRRRRARSVARANALVYCRSQRRSMGALAV